MLPSARPLLTHRPREGNTSLSAPPMCAIHAPSLWSPRLLLSAMELWRSPLLSLTDLAVKTVLLRAQKDLAAEASGLVNELDGEKSDADDKFYGLRSCVWTILLILSDIPNLCFSIRYPTIERISKLPTQISKLLFNCLVNETVALDATVFGLLVAALASSSSASCVDWRYQKHLIMPKLAWAVLIRTLPRTLTKLKLNNASVPGDALLEALASRTGRLSGIPLGAGDASFVPIKCLRLRQAHSLTRDGLISYLKSSKANAISLKELDISQCVIASATRSVAQFCSNLEKLTVGYWTEFHNAPTSLRDPPRTSVFSVNEKYVTDCLSSGYSLTSTAL